jgi:3-oxoacyl-[acyl-carrier-protein] synthase III
MVEDTGVRRPDIGFEAAVQHANLTPIKVKGLDILVTDTCSHGSLLESHANCTHGRLGS